MVVQKAMLRFLVGFAFDHLSDFVEVHHSCPGIDFWKILLETLRTFLHITAGNHDFFVWEFVLFPDRFSDNLPGFLPGGLDKPTGVDDDEISHCDVGNQVIFLFLQYTQHDFAIDEVFCASQTDQCDLFHLPHIVVLPRIRVKRQECNSVIELEAKRMGLRIDFVQQAREGDSFTDMFYFAYPGQGSLQAQSET